MRRLVDPIDPVQTSIQDLNAQGSRKGLKGNVVQNRGCPRNCNRRAIVQMPLGPPLGRRTKAKSLKPGDLPRVVVLFPAGVRWGPRVTVETALWESFRGN